MGKSVVLNNRYRIEDVIGHGGFGITYLAYDKKAEAKCAVKEYFPRDCSVRLQDGRTVKSVSAERKGLFDHGLKRFMDEANVLWKLQDVESVVSVYDRFEENDTGYYVMEYVDGVTLKKLVKETGKLEFKYVNKILFDVGTALIQVHALNIFHRDIKPDNIMVESSGVVKLIDFGSAKNIKRSSPNEQLSVMLTPGFAPFEQYSSKSEQGTFTDVYSLAATVYYLLTAEMLPNPNERLLSGEEIIINDNNIPDYVITALYKALRVRYKERTQTVYEFLIDMKLIDETVYYHQDNNIEARVRNTNNQAYKSKVDNKRLEVKEKKQFESENGKNEDYRYQEYEEYNSHKIVPHPYIEILSGDNAGYVIDLPLDRGVIVGRTKNYAQIIFEQDEYISKRHCEVYYDSLEDLIYVTDLSTNGTWVNGYKLNCNQIYSVAKGSVIVLANQKCSFKVGVTYI